MDPIQAYSGMIAWLSLSTSWSDALLHVNAGLAIMVATAMVLNRAPGECQTFFAVAAAALGNEVLDYLHHGAVMPNTVSDSALRVFWPALYFAMTHIPRVRVGRTRQAENPHSRAV